MSIEILDPTYGGGTAPFAMAGRLASLEGKTVGIISNGKKGTRPFFSALEKELKETWGVASVERLTKSNYSAPADREIMAAAKHWDAAFAGIGD
ncbi:MAG: hypothetical protein O3B08_03230 [Proteobacteria bacterium]|nr:hypothetical protein [Pseudomonadota bacterium]